MTEFICYFHIVATRICQEKSKYSSDISALKLLTRYILSVILQNNITVISDIRFAGQTGGGI